MYSMHLVSISDVFPVQELIDYHVIIIVHIFRDFVENHYVTIKQNNPQFPILIRECSNTKPKVFARYGE